MINIRKVIAVSKLEVFMVLDHITWKRLV